MKRALLCSEGTETAPLVTLASFYEKVGDNTTAASYHRQCVELSQAQGKHLSDYAKSSIFAARYEIDLMTAGSNSTIGEKADLVRAKALLEPVATSNVEEAPTAQELLRKIRTLL